MVKRHIGRLHHEAHKYTEQRLGSSHQFTQSATRYKFTPSLKSQINTFKKNLLTHEQGIMSVTNEIQSMVADTSNTDVVKF